MCKCNYGVFVVDGKVTKKKWNKKKKNADCFSDVCTKKFFCNFINSNDF